MGSWDRNKRTIFLPVKIIVLVRNRVSYRLKDTPERKRIKNPFLILSATRLIFSDLFWKLSFWSSLKSASITESVNFFWTISVVRFFISVLFTLSASILMTAVVLFLRNTFSCFETSWFLVAKFTMQLCGRTFEKMLNDTVLFAALNYTYF